jgi:hypothetical protein
MTKKVQVFTAIFGMVLFCSAMLAQQPVVDIDKKLHPNLAEAQRLVVSASHYVTEAQQGNKYDMNDHAAKAQQLLIQVNQELKAAAEAANAATQKGK